MENELVFGDEYGHGYDYDDDDMDDYKSPTDEDFADDMDSDIIEDDSRIDMGAEWRNYGDGVDPSRVGMARPTDIDEDLGTMIMDDKFKKMEQMSRTPEDMFRIIGQRIITRYDLSEDLFNEAQRIMQYINRQNRKLKFKNPAAIIFALLCIEDTNIIKDRIDKVYEEKAKHEKMSKSDFVRYLFFVHDLIVKERSRKK